VLGSGLVSALVTHFLTARVAVSTRKAGAAQSGSLAWHNCEGLADNAIRYRSKTIIAMAKKMQIQFMLFLEG
jgi:hypothetical protein